MAYQYQNCESYFVINDANHREMARKENAKTYEKHQKEQRQLEIAQELSERANEEYGLDILYHMEEQEVSRFKPFLISRDLLIMIQLKALPDVASIDIQTEIQWFMRPYLLDFLVEAHSSFGLLPETLFLTVNILDRYCSKRIVYRKHYQLVGCTALLIASKYGEPGKKVPRIKELANMCCSLYEEDMFTQMERHVMITLDWIIGPPTVDAFLQFALDDGYYDLEMEHMARYISEIAMFHKEFVSTRPSEMAKASLALSRVILNCPQPPQQDWASQYDSQTLVSLSQSVHHPSQILLQKYRSMHLSRVSLILEDFLTRHAAISRNSMTPPTPPCDRVSSATEKETLVIMGRFIHLRRLNTHQTCHMAALRHRSHRTLNALMHATLASRPEIFQEHPHR